ncbi:uncharacterized protein [Cherax quadricarinatus]|uniref:uncharacterized protein n=1 Tax=Cherax quadricarinatus TaxID=27406 RepID=UPI0023793CB1|nr:uncharacterized protein LOC128691996 [Cherax quadricarinatus]
MAMTSSKNGLNYRSTTYLFNDNFKNKARFSLRRMNSFDCSYEDTSMRVERIKREASAEGRLRGDHFQYTHSSTGCLAPGQKMLRFSDECWCGPAVEHSCDSPTKLKQRTVSKLNSGASVERRTNSQRSLTERRSLSPANSKDVTHRHNRSSDRHYCKTCSIMERRRQFCSSVSLPSTSKPPYEAVTPVSSTPAPSTAVSTEGRRRRSQFRRAWSLFTISCDKDVQRREKSPQPSILRAPTRHIYRRGLSGLPIQCSSNTLGLAY